jgi:phosphoserine aminotransferase
MPGTVSRPEQKPTNPNFSSGPCRKRPGWSLQALEGAALGRSHRSKEGKAKLREVIDLTRQILEIPSDYRIAIVPGSDTGAVEMALWGLLGPRGVDVFAWESFGGDWVWDLTKELAIEDRRVFQAPYGELPDVWQADPALPWQGSRWRSSRAALLDALRRTQRISIISSTGWECSRS